MREGDKDDFHAGVALVATLGFTITLIMAIVLGAQAVWYAAVKPLDKEKPAEKCP